MALIFQQMAGGMPAQAPPQTSVMQPQAPFRQYDKLLKYGATEFKGIVDPLEAEQWLERMDQVFKKLYCTDELKLALHFPFPNTWLLFDHLVCFSLFEGFFTTLLVLGRPS